MKKINKEDFLSHKRSDTVIIYGSGPTISGLDAGALEKLAQFDSIGFNWFCKANIPTTFYTIREQATTPKRRSSKMGITPQDLINYMNNSTYKPSCLIVHDMTDFPNHDYVYSENLEKFKNWGIVLKELRRGQDVAKKFDVGHYNKDIFTEGVYHGQCSLSNVVHIAMGMGYKKIIFVGVDLYDSKYFWRGDKKYLLIKNVNAKHKVGKNTISMLKSIKKKNLIKMYSYNKKSLLSGFLEVWK